MTDIAITAEKANYIRDAHGVEQSDVFAAFNSRPCYFVDDRGRFAMIGPVQTGRFVLAAILPVDGQDGAWRLVTAHWLDEAAARRVYGKD